MFYGKRKALKIFERKGNVRCERYHNEFNWISDEVFSTLSYFCGHWRRRRVAHSSRWWRIVSVQCGAQRGSEWFPVPLSRDQSHQTSASALRYWGHWAVRRSSVRSGGRSKQVTRAVTSVILGSCPHVIYCFADPND